MREFYLENENGQRYALINDSSTSFLWQPSGLGFQNDTQYMESEGFFFKMDSEVGQVAKTGTLVFFKYPYTRYRDFVNYISASQDLKLVYRPYPQLADHFVDIDIESVEKTEIQEDGTLQCNIVMMPKTPWYLPYELNVDLSGTLSASRKEYGYDYNYVYSNTSVAGEVEFNFNAQMDSGLEIIINGAVAAPVLKFYADGTQIGNIDLSSVSASAGEYIRYSSVPLRAGVYKYTSGAETDITSSIGLSATYPTFFMLPPNKQIKAVLTATSLTGVTALIKVYEYFRSV